MSNNNTNEISTVIVGDDLFAPAFKVYDLNNDGFLEKDEIRNAIKKLGDDYPDEFSKQELDEMLEEADRIMKADENGDGRIDYNEFAKFCAKDMFGGGESTNSEEAEEDEEKELLDQMMKDFDFMNTDEEPRKKEDSDREVSSKEEKENLYTDKEQDDKQMNDLQDSDSDVEVIIY